METVRAFVAVEVPEEIHALMATKQQEIRGIIGPANGIMRWSRPESTHLTLQFLGDVPTSMIPAIADAVKDGCAEQPTIELTLARTSAFPGITRPRVLWMGLEGDTGRLVTLQSRISERLKELGYRPDKPFQPHITLARVRDTAQKIELAAISLALQLQENKPIDRVPFTARHISLIKSELRPGGSVYTELAGIELG
ncbi:MAG: RNA 2',3'-cyclic phosphodiesterase [Chloroflexia bacterium]